MVKGNKLLERLRCLGFQLLDTEEVPDVNLALADMVKSRDLRLWEGFPAILANSAEKGLFDYVKAKSYIKKPFDKGNFDSLIALSLALYDTCRMRFSWAGVLYDLLDARKRKERHSFFDSLKRPALFKLGKHEMSPERLKTAFHNYFAHTGRGLDELLSAKEELGFEYALSQVFPPKQKDLFLKKLKGEKLTKTESEYFSRVVRKKVLALANAELHRLSQKLLE